ncbi:MAG: hypothetical protein EBS53_18235, partial [Bacteroidetes bacterium]|nr:hypothetical protein [Bacteroidota bacterium]
MRDSSTIVNINSGFANEPALNIQNGGLVNINTTAVQFDSVVIGTEGGCWWGGCTATSVITTGGFSGTWNGTAYSSTPGINNGQLHIKATNAVTVGGFGLIHMDGKGYRGGQDAGEDGYSVGGPNTFGAGKAGGNGSAASYASLACNAGSRGPGIVFGASDFATQLYLGSGGGNRLEVAGGNGGGAIKITAGSLTNGGTIRADGTRTGGGNNNGGSGGTIYFSVTGEFANTNTISVNGADCGGYGRVKIDAGSLGNSTGTINGMVDSNITAKLTQNITSISYAPGQLEIVDNSKTYRMGFISTTSTQNHNWEKIFSGKSIQTLSISGGTAFSFDQANNITMSVGTLTIAGGSVVSFNAATNVSIANLSVRDSSTIVNINSGFANEPALNIQNGGL